ncbi:phosphomannomutase/phosphoglucomutase, partial [Candidatus Gracilibacteria bacterium]|nr:phosphomannomutase/phosphoglucomutase [Candidatus Gracilibacteria bacterium]
MNLSIIDKSYDIRGIYGVDLDEDLFYKLGFAFADLNKNLRNFVVGGDVRLSTEVLKKSMISGIIDAGKNVIDIDLCSTDMIYFASGKYDEIDIGLMITASHNPTEYNGLKACFKNAFPINMKETGKEIKK